MKKFYVLLLLALALVISGGADAQTSSASGFLWSSATAQVGIGTATPTTGASLDLGSKTDSILLPIGTTGQRPTPTAGMLRYNSTVPQVEAYYSGGWNPLGASAGFSLTTTGSSGAATLIGSVLNIPVYAATGCTPSGAQYNILLNNGSSGCVGSASLTSDANNDLFVTSTQAKAFAVGANGSTNPAFSVDDSQGSQASGVNIQGAASGGTNLIQAIDSGSNASLKIQSKGTGNLIFAIPNGGGTMQFQQNNQTFMSSGNSGITFGFSPPTSSNANIRWTFTPVNDTALSASTNAPYISFSGGGVTRQHATGAQTLQTDVILTGNADSYVAASALTDGVTLEVVPKSCGTNCTATNESGLLVPSTAISGTVTNGYGINVAAPTGPTNNFAAKFTGPVVNTSTVTTGGFTVSTLPAGTVGMRAYVTDQTTSCPSVGGTLTGSGAVVCPVFYNGTAWVGG